MHRELAPVIRFARLHHRRQWSVTGFVGAINARLFEAPVEGGRIPGISCIAGSSAIIGIDDSLTGTPYRVPILAHEVGHLVLERAAAVDVNSEPKRWFLCAPFGSKSRVAESWNSPLERNAWFAAAILAVSRPQMERFTQGLTLPIDLASECMCPAEFVNFSYAVHEAMDDELPIHLRAANLAYERWMKYLTDTLRQRQQ